MDDWRIQDDEHIREIDEDDLRRRLRKGDLDGTELVRPPGAEAWVPLHDTALFREEVPFIGDPWVAARRRSVQGFLGHLGSFAVVLAMLWIITGAFPAYLLWWGLFVALHGIRVIGPALELWRGHGEAAPEPVATPAVPEPTRSEFLQTFDQALDALRAQLQASPVDHAPDLDGLRKAAVDLDARGQQIVALADPEVEARLTKERAEVDEQLKAAGSERSSEALEAQRSALDTRLAAIAEARDVQIRLRARQRTLLHELEALRAELLRAALREGPEGPELAEQVERLRRETAASEEVDEVLARARRSRQATTG
jgi:hypothetical protein